MNVEGFEIPDGLRYSKEHEWIMLEGEKGRIGITDYAQKSLHEVVFVDLPPIGRLVTQKDAFGTVESVKAVSELYSPISGEIIERNENLVSSPELVNKDPYGAGWIVIVKPSRLDDEIKALLTAESYASYIKELAEKK
jgi:glycine cleavage system H protein